jgi:hypothetical protein
MGIFLFTTESRTALGPIQPPIQRVLGALFLGVKRPEREADHSPPSSAEVKNEWSYISTPPIRSVEAQGQLYLFTFIIHSANILFLSMTWSQRILHSKNTLSNSAVSWDSPLHSADITVIRYILRWSDPPQYTVTRQTPTGDRHGNQTEWYFPGSQNCSQSSVP